MAHEAHCQKCGETSPLREVLAVWICPSCVVELRVWLGKRRWRNHGVWEDQCRYLTRRDGGFTSTSLARQMGRTRQQAKDWVIRAFRRGVLVRIGVGEYRLSPSRMKTAFEGGSVVHEQ